MKKHYVELMEKIEVTDAMRSRILHNLQNGTAEAKTKPFPAVGKYLPIAACLVVLLASPFVLPRVLDNTPNGDEIVTDTWRVTEVDSLAALEETVGFAVQEIDDLPFVPQTVTYLAYGSEVAEILYENGAQTACFRISAGQEDNSGDYTAYAETELLAVGDVTVTLKGDGGRYPLAVWSDGAYAYSLRLSEGLSAAEWQDLLMGIEPVADGEDAGKTE